MGRMTAALDRWSRATIGAWIDSRDGIKGWKRSQDSFARSCGESAESLASMVDERVGIMVRYAWEHSPYYRAAWSKVGIRPNGEFGLNDLAQLPLIDKGTIKSHKHELRANGYSLDKLFVSQTGGTTGTQTTFYLDKQCRSVRIGRQRGILAKLGYEPGMRRGLIWGAAVDLLDRQGMAALKDWIRQYGAADVTLCCTTMSESIMREYFERLKRFRPQVLYGYPTAIARLARFVLANRLAPIAVRSTFVTAERLSSADRSVIHEAFGGDVFDLYCTREYGCVAFECDRHRGLHVDMENACVEIVCNGCVVGPGMAGEIVVTDLNNVGMPLIRSRTGDLGAWATDSCGCGLPFPLLQYIGGREVDSLIRPDGVTVAGLMLADCFAGECSVRAAQFLQNQVDLVTVRIEVDEAYDSAVEARCVSELRQFLGNDVSIQIERVGEIPRNPVSGKYREVICNVARQAVRS